MLDHVGLNVSDLAASRAFFARTLQPVGYSFGMEHGNQVGFVGPDGYPRFWIARRDPVGGSTHLCFRALDRAAVDAFHAAGLGAGGRDNGAPGIREYDERYYAAYVLDPDGNNVEAVTYEE